MDFEKYHNLKNNLENIKTGYYKIVSRFTVYKWHNSYEINGKDYDLFEAIILLGGTK